MSRFEVPPISLSKMLSSRRFSVTMLDPILTLWVNFTKRACKASKKLTSGGSPKTSLAAKPRQLLATISNKTLNLRHIKKKTNRDEHGDEEEEEEYDFGDGGLWQRSILMGDKCQPLDFPGVIYYNSDGKRLSELPMKSPARASPLPSYVLSKKE